MTVRRVLYIVNRCLNYRISPCAVNYRSKDHNRFEYIQHFLFYDLTEIEEINLSNNQLAFVHPNAFTELGMCSRTDHKGYYS